MVRWGAHGHAAEREVLQPYLAAAFRAPKPAAPRMRTPTPGRASYKRACLTCHDADIIEQQRLTRTGWTRRSKR